MSCMKVHDIEDLCRFGKTQQGCPYYTARHFAGMEQSPGHKFGW